VRAAATTSKIRVINLFGVTATAALMDAKFSTRSPGSTSVARVVGTAPSVTRHRAVRRLYRFRSTALSTGLAVKQPDSSKGRSPARQGKAFGTPHGERSGADESRLGVGDPFEDRGPIQGRDQLDEHWDSLGGRESAASTRRPLVEQQGDSPKNRCRTEGPGFRGFIGFTSSSAFGSASGFKKGDAHST